MRLGLKIPNPKRDPDESLSLFYRKQAQNPSGCYWRFWELLVAGGLATMFGQKISCVWSPTPSSKLVIFTGLSRYLARHHSKTHAELLKGSHTFGAYCRAPAAPGCRLAFDIA